MGEDTQQSKNSNSKNTLAECSKETHTLGSEEDELKHFASSQDSALGP